MVTKDLDKWNNYNPPPKGHRDVGQYVYRLFEEAKEDKERQGRPERWAKNFKLYRNKFWNAGGASRYHMSINLAFADIERIVANLTSREPIASVMAGDGKKETNKVVIPDEVISKLPKTPSTMALIQLYLQTAKPKQEELQPEELISEYLAQWRTRTRQLEKLETSMRHQEIYGVTIEKCVPVFGNANMEIETIVIDPYAFFCCPGYYDEIGKAPYVLHVYDMDVNEAEHKFKPRKKIEPDTDFSVLAKSRDTVGSMSDIVRFDQTGSGTSPLDSATTAGYSASGATSENQIERALIIEAWVRDYSMEKVTVEIKDEITGEIISKESEQLKYPGGIRRIVITNAGELVLADDPNPSINPAIDRKYQENMYGWDRFPFYLRNSYKDYQSVWGFSLCEQYWDIIQKFNELVSRLFHYIVLSSCPPLIVPKGCGIHHSKLDNRPGTILEPSNPAMSQYIRYVPVAPISTDVWNFINFCMSSMDRIAAIQDVDRGDPGGVKAASAIVALQERNAILMRHKIRNADYMVRERGRWAINYLQNFHIWADQVEIAGESYEFRGTDYADRIFNYEVEGGSTFIKTDLMAREEIMKLYQMGLVSRELVLKTLKPEGWKEEIEKIGEGQVDQALAILVQAGMPQEMAMQLKPQLMLKQGGPGNMAQSGANSPTIPPIGTPGIQPGTPVAAQGQMPPQVKM